MRTAVSATSPHPDPLRRRIGVLWLTHWQTDRLRASAEPGIVAGRPLVTAIQSGPRMIVAAACAEAQRHGLHPGMRLAQAQAMLPDLMVMPARAQQDAEGLARLADWCRRYTPHLRAELPDGVWLDLTGCAHLHGGETALLDELAGRLDRAGLSARAAIAATPGAAHAMARYGPHSVTSVPARDMAVVLGTLPVEALRLEPEPIALLHRFGLRTIGALAAVPRGPLTRRLGAAVMRRLDQAFGRLEEPIRPDLPASVLQERVVFLEPLLTAEAFAAANAVLTASLCRTLETSCLGARRLELVFVRVDGSCCVQEVALARPSHGARHIGRLLDERLERVDPGEGVEAMWLVVLLAEPMTPEQARLQSLAELAVPAADRLRDLAPLIDTLQNRLGPGRLWRAVPVESDVPERSVQRQAPLEIRLESSRSWPASLPRPVRLIDPPQPVQALAGLPDHAPLSFTWRRRRHRVRCADGPERIAGEWWVRSGEMFAVRDYFRVEDEDGRRYWLFRRGDGVHQATGDLGWFLHGLF